MSDVVRLGDVTEKPERREPSNEIDGPQFTYIDIGSVSADAKEIQDPATLSVSEAPSRARQVVQAGDVLVSTVRPNLNAVAVVSSELNGAIASTGFAVLRPMENRLHGRYLFQITRTQAFISRLMRDATGQSYPATSDSKIRDVEIPLPPLAEQRRIAAILDKADAVRRKRRLSIERAEMAASAAFRQIFGDVNDWPTRRVGDAIAGFETGKNVKPAEESSNTRDYILKVSAVTWGEYDSGEAKPLPADYVPPEHHYVRQSDLLISRANTSELVGATAYVWATPPDRVLPDKIWRFIWREPTPVLPLYVHELFKQPGIRREIQQRATGTSGSMKNISQAKVLDMEIPVPPLELQAHYTRVIERLRRYREKNAASGRAVDSLSRCLALKLVQ